MIRSTDIQPDTYKSGQFLRRWSINENGQAVCVEDAYAIADTEQATLDAQSNRNALSSPHFSKDAAWEPTSKQPSMNHVQPKNKE